MQELVGRLTALDAQASEGLKVIAYFDALIEGQASFEVLLRGGAILSGCATGFVAGRNSLSVDQHGTRAPTPIIPRPGEWPERSIGTDGRVWLERSGPPHANDDIILERLAIAVRITLHRTAPVSSSRRTVETIIDRTETLERRRAACAQLKLRNEERYRIVAEPSGSSAAIGHHTIVATPAGSVRATILRQDDTFSTPDRAGIGALTSPDALDRSWTSALAALRLTSPHEPVLSADELGGLALLAEAPHAHVREHPDLAALTRVLTSAPHSIDLFEAVVATESIRAAAGRLGLHHSTVQSRVAEFSSSLGYGIATSSGRARLAVALKLHYLVSNRF